MLERDATVFLLSGAEDPRAAVVRVTLTLAMEQHCVR